MQRLQRPGSQSWTRPSSSPRNVPRSISASHALTLPQAKIHERINADLPLFEQQLASSETVQERFVALRANVDELNDAVSHSEVVKPHSCHTVPSNSFAKLGIIPTVVHALSTHAALAQRTQDTETTLDAIERLLRCREELDHLASLANNGKLAEAVQASTRLQNLLDAAPPALKEAEVFSSLKVRPSQCVSGVGDEGFLSRLPSELRGTA